ncbi:MAG TPA: hypothetical protein VFB23_08655 [Candidatus Acidoferrales bacterium]|jgi:hypothetical protein|nr:hypothetical protein [Candidatus Acidoferrales bacterium]
MNRWIQISALGVTLALCARVQIHAQHAHGGGAGLGPAGAGAPGLDRSGPSGRSNVGNAPTATPHSSVMASKNPGGVLDHNTQLASKLETLLNLSGPNALSVLKTDASGFKNFGQFVAAVHVSHNLGIPFSDLQAKMTGPNAVSLGKAIQQLKPQANAKDETTKATKQADEDVKDTTPET